MIYLSIIISAFGACLGLFGETRDKRKTGWRQLTRLGWVSLSAIIAGMVVTMYLSYQSQSESDFVKQQVRQARKVAYAKILYECEYSTRPIINLFLQTRQVQGSRPIDRSNFLVLCDSMTSDKGVRLFSNANFADSSFFDTGFDEWNVSYLKYLNGFYSSERSKGIEKAIKEWSTYLNPSDIVLMDSIVNHSYPSSLESAILQYSGSGPFYYFDSFDHVLIGHINYILKIKTLYAHAQEIIKNSD